MLRTSGTACLVALTSLSLCTAPARAQCFGCSEANARGDGLTLAGNALIGGATAAVRARMHRRPVVKAFAAGTLGGALTYAGKRIVAERMEGAGFIGREVAAIGTSLSATAAEGRGLVDRLVLPLGPARLYVTVRGPGPALRARVDAAAVAAAAYTAVLPGARFDARQSLSAGALVFRMDRELGETSYDGRHVAGVVLVRDGDDPARVARAAGHERVHVVQYDQSFLLWSAPAEARLMERAGWSRSLGRWVDLGLNAPVLAGLGALVPYNVQPWETEADYLARTARDDH